MKKRLKTKTNFYILGFGFWGFFFQLKPNLFMVNRISLILWTSFCIDRKLTFKFIDFTIITFMYLVVDIVYSSTTIAHKAVIKTISSNDHSTTFHSLHIGINYMNL